MLSRIRAFFSVRPRPADNPDALWDAACALLGPHMRLNSRPGSKVDHRSRREVQSAISYFERILVFVPNSWAAYWMLGKAHQFLSNHAPSRDAFAQAWALNPGSRDVGRELGIALTELGEFEAALEICRELVTNHPGDPGLIANFGLALLMVGDVKHAQTRIQEALSLDPSDPITAFLDRRIAEIAAGQRAIPKTPDGLRGP